MPKDYSKEERRSLRPPPPVSAVAMMAQSQGASRWVGGPVPPNSFDYQTKNTTNSQRPRRPGAANRVPPEIALKISKHLDIRDLARAALVWRPATEATYASPQFIMSECGRFSLMTNNMLAWPPEVMRSVRERIAQYNFAWSTLQYTSGKFFSIPETTEETPWAGSFGWKSGNRFMGESNGHLYDVGSWMAPGPSTGLQMWARVCLYQVPSLRTGQTELIRRQFNVALMSHYVKAVCVDPFAQLVAILE
ncbi:hypothetical protein FB451DRAFT_726849 [Mycena latifolia]|nr:hypothetical protein FB451DRAFT_726849 [Mycena latifolia]